MATKPLFVGPNSSRPLQHHDACVGLESSRITQWTRVISPLNSINHSGGRTPPDSPPCYRNLWETHRDSFCDAYLALLTPNLWLIYVNAPILNPFFHIAPIRECKTLIYTTARIFLLSPTALLDLRAYNLDPFFAFFHANSSPKMNPWIDYL